MLRCLTCEYRNQDGHMEPCIRCRECGVPYDENVNAKLNNEWRLSHDLPQELENICNCIEYAQIGMESINSAGIGYMLFSRIFTNLKTLAWKIMVNAGKNDPEIDLWFR